MPWQETSALDERIRMIEEFALSGQQCNKSELSRRYGISRPTLYKWLERYAAGGESGLRDLSRAPDHQPQRTPEPLMTAILQLRQLHPSWGPRKLLAWLERRSPQVRWPAASTIGDELRRRHLTQPRRRRRRVEPYTRPFQQVVAANDSWSIDFKGWFRTGDGRRCDPLTVSDNSSRYLLACRIVDRPDQGSTRAVLEAVFREYGLPLAIRSDNGSPFASRGIGGLSQLSVWWLKLGIIGERVAPASPQENGRHERMHGTLKRETASPPQRSRLSQQAAFDRFRAEYNRERPHEALDQAVPADFYVPSPRPYPRRLEDPEYGAGLLVRRVRQNGTFKWRGSEVFLGEALAGEPVGLEMIDERYSTVYFCQWALGVFDSWQERVLRVEEALRAGLAQESLGLAFRYLPAPGSAEEAPPIPKNCKGCAQHKM